MKNPPGPDQPTYSRREMADFLDRAVLKGQFAWLPGPGVEYVSREEFLRRLAEWKRTHPPAAETSPRRNAA